MPYYCKCKYFGLDCEWLVRANFIKRLDMWKIRKYNGPYTCTVRMISQDYTKLDADMIARYIAPMVGANPSFKVKLVIAEIHSKQKAIKKCLW